MESSERPTPPVRMSVPEENSTPPGADPPNPVPEPEPEAPVTEDRTPRDAVFLTEAQEIRRRIDAIGAGIVVLNLMVGALLGLYVLAVIQEGKVSVDADAD